MECFDKYGYATQEEVNEINERTFCKYFKAVCYWLFMVLLVIGLVAVFRSCEKPAFASTCQDPNTLSPEMKKAYYELKKASKELGGFTVSIRCGKDL